MGKRKLADRECVEGETLVQHSLLRFFSSSCDNQFFIAQIRVPGRFTRRAYAFVDGDERAVLVSERTGRPDLKSSDHQASISATTGPSIAKSRSSDQMRASEPAAPPYPETSNSEEDLFLAQIMPQHAEPPKSKEAYGHSEIVYISQDHKELHACCLDAGSRSHLQSKHTFLGLANVAL